MSKQFQPQIFTLTKANLVRAFPVCLDYAEAIESMDRRHLQALFDEAEKLMALPVKLESHRFFSPLDTYRKGSEEQRRKACHFAWQDRFWELRIKHVTSRTDLRTLEMELSYCLDAPDKMPAGSVVFDEDWSDYIIEPSEISR